ncbi:hypothetical protein [Paenisporosarcina antarctica]|nr:hypothetical protein [Paenisporosarcina antarctica]
MCIRRSPQPKRAQVFDFGLREKRYCLSKEEAAEDAISAARGHL